MRYLVVCGMALMIAVPVMASPTLQISMGTRETGTTAAIGQDGGTANGIEWINLDGQTLTLDGTWQQFTFDMLTDPVTAFAGSTADGVLDGDAGTVEHIRFKSTGFDGPITLWIDDVAEYWDPTGVPPGSTVTFGDYEGYLAGDEVIFQEPSFSGSTAGNLLAGSTAGVDTTVALNGVNSYKVDWQFVDNATTRWLRLTTFNTPNIPNPTIKYTGDAAVVSFWIKGIPEPASLSLLALGALGLLRRRR